LADGGDEELDESVEVGVSLDEEAFTCVCEDFV